MNSNEFILDSTGTKITLQTQLKNCFLFNTKDFLWRISFRSSTSLNHTINRLSVHLMDSDDLTPGSSCSEWIRNYDSGLLWKDWWCETVGTAPRVYTEGTAILGRSWLFQQKCALCLCVSPVGLQVVKVQTAGKIMGIPRSLMSSRWLKPGDQCGYLVSEMVIHGQIHIALFRQSICNNGLTIEWIRIILE